MRNGVRRKCAAEQVGRVVKPIHDPKQTPKVDRVKSTLAVTRRGGLRHRHPPVGGG
jgi:hypothetical protein